MPIIPYPAVQGISLTVQGVFTSLQGSRLQRQDVGRVEMPIRLDAGLVPDITIAVRMNEANAVPLDYYLLPSIDMPLPCLRLGRENGLSLDAYRFGTLDFFSALAGRAKFSEAV